MLSPEYLAEITESAEEVSSRLHTAILKDIIKRVMIRLARGDSYTLTATDKWAIETLLESGRLREDIVAEIAKSTHLQRSVIRQAFQDAGVRSIAYDAQIYEAAGIATQALRQSPQLLRLLQVAYERTMHEWENITQTTADAAQRLFIEVCDDAFMQVASGGKSASQAIMEAVDRVSQNGVIVTYPTGHKDTIETATTRAVRTGIAQSAAQTTFARMAEMGVDLVLTSSHLGARPTHQPWQGHVFHVNFAVIPGMIGPFPPNRATNYPDLVASTRYGYVDGLCGANCRHSVVPYIEGVTQNPFKHYDSKENAEQYEKTQKQRALERKIRKVKRAVQGIQEALKTADDKTRPELEKLHHKRGQQLTALNKEYKAFCEANDLKTRQERLRIAGWGREQAAIASGAARKGVANPGKRDTMVQEGYGSGVPLEYQSDNGDYEQLSIPAEERQTLLELRVLSDRSGYEYGSAFGSMGFVKPFTSNERNRVGFSKTLYANEAVKLFHSHTNSTMLSGEDLRLLLNPNIKSISVITKDRDVFVAEIGNGHRPDEAEFDDFLKSIRKEAESEKLQKVWDTGWTEDEYLYYRVYEQAFRVMREFGWRIERGRI